MTFPLFDDALARCLALLAHGGTSKAHTEAITITWADGKGCTSTRVTPEVAAEFARLRVGLDDAAFGFGEEAS